MNKTITLPPLEASKLCYHCHLDAESEPIYFDDKVFCCHGCQTVYSILNENQLCNFYQIDQQAGRTIAEIRDAKQYAYLNDPDVEARLVKFAEGDIKHVVFRLPQVHCASCIWLLEQLYKLNPGILRSRLNFLRKEVTIHYDSSQTDLAAVAALLSQIGYAPDLNLEDLSDNHAHSMDRSLYYKVALAFFAFGNVMLLSFPEYLGIDKGVDTGFYRFFGWISLGLSTPVLFYSARDYIISAYQGLKRGYLNIDVPLAAGILMLYGRSFYEIITQIGAGYLDSFNGLVFFLLLGKWVQMRTWGALSFERDYKSYFPISAIQKIGNQRTSVPVAKLSTGDIIEIQSQTIIPADGILLRGDAAIDYSFVTGESEPVTLKVGEKIFAGGRQTKGLIEVTLTQKVNQSYLTQLWNDEAFNQKRASKQSALADWAGQWFTKIILGVGGLSFFYWYLLCGDLTTAINSFTAVMIVACPCAVALSIPFTFSNLMRLMGRIGFYLKNTQTIEHLADINTIVFDKTGTISQVSHQDLVWHGEPFSREEKELVAALAGQSGHPLSRQIVLAMGAPSTGAICHSFQDLAGQGISGIIDGHHLRIGSPSFVGCALEGTCIEIDGQVKGAWKSEAKYRSGLQNVISRLRQISHLYLLSGDNSAQSERLKPLFPEPDSMHFEQLPQDKLQFIKDLQSKGQKTLMVGDGLNDAGALAQADIGIVITEDINNFTPASDAILDAQSFHLLPDLLAISKTGVRIVRRSFMLAGIYNLVGMSYAVSGTLKPIVAAILMPLSSITIVVFGVISGHLAMRKMMQISARNDVSHKSESGAKQTFVQVFEQNKTTKTVLMTK